MSGREQVAVLVRLIENAAYDALHEHEKHGKLPTLDSLESHPLDSEVNLNLKKTIRTLEGACDQLCTLLAPPAHTIVNRVQDSYWACLRVAAKAGIADILADKPSGVHVRDISAQLQIEESKITSILRVLAARHCFYEVKENVFANNRLSIQLLSSNDMSSLVDLATCGKQRAASDLQECLTNPNYALSSDPTLSPMMYALRKDNNFAQLRTFYDFLNSDSQRCQMMGRAMVAANGVKGTLSVVHVFPWDRYRTVCDVGSGVGSFAWSLLAQYPSISVALIDQPGTIAIAEQVWAKDHGDQVAAGRVTFFEGDFFDDIPAKNIDIYYLRNVVHNWPDTQALIILRNVRQAMSPSSRVLIHDYTMRPLTRNVKENSFGLEEAPEPLLPSYGAGQIRLYEQDLGMMMLLNSKERTIEEVENLGRQADLELQKVWDLGETTVLEFVPT